MCLKVRLRHVSAYRRKSSVGYRYTRRTQRANAEVVRGPCSQARFGVRNPYLEATATVKLEISGGERQRRIGRTFVGAQREVDPTACVERDAPLTATYLISLNIFRVSWTTGHRVTVCLIKKSPHDIALVILWP